ncbi:MAG: maltose alpha-D-glucosyltransferase / alpha-amylase [Chloroflexota bacterium]|nr:maltose alpha-D-glucosyltransferase / alpha-amylase [Chloroflexota bacterium]
MEKDLWYKNSVFYEVHTRAFFDSNRDGIGDLRGLTQKLDYLKHLGIDCIWLLPIYPSPLEDDGYDISDFYHVHPDLGTLEDFKTLVNETHKRGMRIIADLVVNHTSNQCEWFRKAESDPQSPYHDYYVWSDSDRKYTDARIIFIDTEKSNWSWNEKAGQYFWHRFYSSQPDLNYDNPAVREEMKSIMRFWLDLGIDGFRADAVPYLIEREGTSCENLPETHEYLKELRALMDADYPNRILLAEANQWPRDLRPYFGDGDEFHMAFRFPLMPRMYESIASGDASSMIDILEKTPEIPENCQWCTFLRNHDELTLEMVTEEERQFLWNYYAPEARMRLNLGIRRRLAPLMGGDPVKIELLYAMLFSLPGAPIIYFGDEIGMGDDIWLNDRDGVRTPMQWSAEANAGFSEREDGQLFLPVIDQGDYSYKKLNVESQMQDDDSLFNRLRKLIALRKSQAIFNTQSMEFLFRDNPHLFAVRRGAADASLICIHNLSSQPQEVDLSAYQYKYLAHSANQSPQEKDQNGSNFVLQPYAYVWLETGA